MNKIYRVLEQTYYSIRYDSIAGISRLSSRAYLRYLVLKGAAKIFRKLSKFSSIDNVEKRDAYRWIDDLILLLTVRVTFFYVRN